MEVQVGEEQVVEAKGKMIDGADARKRLDKARKKFKAAEKGNRVSEPWKAARAKEKREMELWRH